MTKGLLAFVVLFAAACGSGRGEFGVEFIAADSAAGLTDVILIDTGATGARRRPPLESAGDLVRAKSAESGSDGIRAAVKSDTGGIRFVVYDCVLNGAAGILFLKDEALKPEALIFVERVARELRALAPVFAHRRAIALPFEPPTKGWLARAWTYHGRDYLVLANRTKDRQWKVPEEALKSGWRPLFEARRDPRELLTEYGGSYYLKPYQVLVLESRLRPKRLLGR